MSGTLSSEGLARPVRVAVVGAGQFGKNHVRVVGERARQSKEACEQSVELAAVVDADAARAAEVASPYQCPAFTDWRELISASAVSGPKIDAAIVAVPTIFHAEVGCALMEAGIDVLIEKPIAPDLESADRLLAVAEATNRVLQVGHLERFNPAVLALEQRATLPLFFEIHRMSVFTPRSLDIDVVLDLMIHDLDVILALVHSPLAEIRAAGISILSSRVDIANVRLQFEDGCVANITASRVSTEKVRKLRLFQPGQYVSVDYAKQEMLVISVDENRHVGFEPVKVVKNEPLSLQFEAFLESVRNRKRPKLSGIVARRTLEVAREILDRIEGHAKVVSKTLAKQTAAQKIATCRP